MTYDGLVLAGVVAELNRILTGGRVQKIRQHSDTDITLEIRSAGHTYMLFFSVEARFSRVYLASSSAPVPQSPPNFCMVMRKYVEGAFISKVEQVGFDRIMRVHTQSHGQDERVLIFEIMGKHSNLILTDADDKILGAIKNIGSSVSRVRQILAGRQYLPPPGGDKIDPRTINPEAFDHLWKLSLQEEAVPADSINKWLMNTFSGFGPFLADEIIKRASDADTVSNNRIKAELFDLIEMVKTSAYVPVFITGDRGEGLMVYPTPSVQFPPDRQHERVSINEALDTLFRTLVSRTAIEEERTQLLTNIRRAAASRKQAIKSIERTISESERADTYKQIGELLLASLSSVEIGAKTTRLVNYFDSDMPEIEIELDEKLNPIQNAERYFKRYQKSRDAASTAHSRKERVLSDLDILEAAKNDAESAKSVDSLKALRKMLIDRDLLRQEVDHERQADEFAGYKIRRFMTPEGWEILHGENSTSNDYLTQRVARPNDVWLHARSITGAHVVIKTAGHSSNVPHQVLMQAAMIAAQNSDAKHSSLVPIDHTFRKHVRKPRNSAPGFVTYRNEKTIDVRMK